MALLLGAGLARRRSGPCGLRRRCLLGAHHGPSWPSGCTDAGRPGGGRWI